ncbi:MAG TPA: type I-E CRISPR-associated endonuclease Cas1e [Burkholderiales bacterium]|nr:type I-E CRISPR-associated endonuclease Cas1e [Burkholderiales bacterium]
MSLDLRTLPKVRDSWSFLYAEHSRIDVEDKSIAIHDAEGKTAVPCAAITLLMLGPGTSISHAAIRALADNGCMVSWNGEHAVRFYACGTGETRSARNLYRQIARWANPTHRLSVVRAMYELRFDDPIPPHATLRQIRGMEGARVRDTYAHFSRVTGVPWNGRQLGRAWTSLDPVNKALSSANSALYGICHAAIVSAGYSPAVGFVHTGKQLSFVYDIADLYKTEITIPIAFRVAFDGEEDIERRARVACRDLFHEKRLLKRIMEDIEAVLSASAEAAEDDAYAEDAARPGGLWDPVEGIVPGGHNYAADAGEPWT